jgi:TonB family protein
MVRDDPSSSTRQPQPGPDLGTMSFLLEDDRRDRRGMRLGITAAVLLHALAFVVNWPNLAGSATERAPERIVIRVPILSMTPPEPPPMLEIPQVPQARTIPIPDPEPFGPEPVREKRREALEIEVPPDVFIGDVEDVPPPPEPQGPIIVGVQVSRPEVLHRVQPRYTSAALGARIVGAVVVQLTIDTDGRVRDVQVLRGLPFGLTEQAVEAVRQWRFAPSRLDGRPVPVLYNLTIHFNINRP